MLFLAYVKNSFPLFKLLTFLIYSTWSHAGTLSSFTAVAAQVKTTASLHKNRFPLLTSSFFPHIKNNIFFSFLKSFSYHWFSKYYDHILISEFTFPFHLNWKTYITFSYRGKNKWLDWELENWKLLVNSGLQLELTCESFLMFFKIDAICRGYTEVQSTFQGISREKKDDYKGPLSNKLSKEMPKLVFTFCFKDFVYDSCEECEQH